jgi:hypothetical protein
VRRDDRHETTVKENNNGGWSSDDVVLWLWRRQNRDMIEWWGEWTKLRWSFYNNGWWKSGGLRKAAYGGGVYSMFQFQLERGADGTKRCRKMKQRQRARLGSMERKRDPAWWCDDVGRRRGDTGEGKGRRHVSWADVNLTGLKSEENSYDQFNWYKWMVKI